MSMGSTELARKLRKSSTVYEQKLWGHLRNRKLRDLKFLRQHPIFISQIEQARKFYIADFYCAERKLIIELDGGYHSTQEQKEYDRIRDTMIKEKGLTVLRIENNEDSFIMLNQIKQFLDNPPHPSL